MKQSLLAGILCLLTVGFVNFSQAQIGIFEASMDIGSEERLGAEGSAVYDEATDTYTITGSGDDVWNDVDAFHFLYMEWSGDFNIIADVTIDGNPGQDWIKSMMMARQDLTPGSPNITTRIRRDGNTVPSGAELPTIPTPKAVRMEACVWYLGLQD